MKTVILYASKHQGNTKKLVDAIVAAHPDVDTIDVKSLSKQEVPDLSDYPLIGVASGIYYSEIDKGLARCVSECLQKQDHVFGLITYGGKNKWYGKDIDGICRMKQAVFMGIYGCAGFDNWGPFKLVGGLQQGHPTQEEIDGCVSWYNKLVDDYADIIEEAYAQRSAQLAWEKEHPAGGLGADIKRSLKKIADKF